MKKIILFILLRILICNYNSNIECLNKKIKFYSNNQNSTKRKDKKNLLLSVIVKYSLEKVLPFLKSFIRSGIKNCDIVFFINQISESTINYLKSFGIILCEIPGKLDDPLIIYKYRWKLYRDYLLENKEKYNIILSVDIKDTIIQNEFFKFYENYKPFIGFSFESANIEKLINKDWIINNFGIKPLKTIENKRVINAGTIWGTLNEFYEFSNILYDKLRIYPTVIDQTLLNYLIYHEKILKKCLQIKSDEFGPVLTLGLTKRKNIILDEENNILNNNGQIASIVHQYDRHPDLKKIIKSKYCPELIKFVFIKNFFIIFEALSFVIFLKYIIVLIKLKITNKLYNFV